VRRGGELGESSCVILSEAKEAKRGFGSFASLRMTYDTRIDLEASARSERFSLLTLDDRIRTVTSLEAVRPRGGSFIKRCFDGRPTDARTLRICHSQGDQPV
jgi:hypothetical protein